RNFSTPAASPQRPNAKASPNRKPDQRNGSEAVARIVAGIGSSHVPAIGAALDNGKTEEPYWKRIFSGFEKSQAWMRETKPDVAIIVYNDHASAFSVEMIPTFALGCAAEFPPARSEEHTSELQSLTNLVCRLLLE